MISKPRARTSTTGARAGIPCPLHTPPQSLDEWEKEFDILVAHNDFNDINADHTAPLFITIKDFIRQLLAER
jgi:hypothetical protein